MGQTVIKVPPIGYLVLVFRFYGGDVGGAYSCENGGIQPVVLQKSGDDLSPIVLSEQNAVHRLEIGLTGTDVVLQSDLENFRLIGIGGVVASPIVPGAEGGYGVLRLAERIINSAGGRREPDGQLCTIGILRAPEAVGIELLLQRGVRIHPPGGLDGELLRRVGLAFCNFLGGLSSSFPQVGQGRFLQLGLVGGFIDGEGVQTMEGKPGAVGTFRLQGGFPAHGICTLGGVPVGFGDGEV